MTLTIPQALCPKCDAPAELWRDCEWEDCAVAAETRCERCEGRGWHEQSVDRSTESIEGYEVVRFDCPDCAGPRVDPASGEATVT